MTSINICVLPQNEPAFTGVPCADIERPPGSDAVFVRIDPNKTWNLDELFALERSISEAMDILLADGVKPLADIDLAWEERIKRASG